MIEELNKVLEKKNIYLEPYKSGTNEWRLYRNEDDIVCGNFYISDSGQYEFNLSNHLLNRNVAKEIKQEIAKVISYYDDYS